MTIAASPSAGGKTINLAGLQTDQYMKTGVVMYNHGRDIVLDNSGIKEIRLPNDAIPIARTKSLVRGDGDSWVADFDFLTGDPLADRVRNAWDKGFLRSASISWVGPDDKPQLTEWSICPIGADPDAMRSAYLRTLDAVLESPIPEKETGHDRRRNQEGYRRRHQGRASR